MKKKLNRLATLFNFLRDNGELELSRSCSLLSPCVACFTSVHVLPEFVVSALCYAALWDGPASTDEPNEA